MRRGSGNFFKDLGFSGGYGVWCNGEKLICLLNVKWALMVFGSRSLPRSLLFPGAIYPNPGMNLEVEVQDTYVRNRKRSKRRGIYCPHHGCYLDSVSQKYPLYTESAEKLRSRGVNRLAALMLVASQTAVRLDGEWIEAFWCGMCQETRWYYVRREERGYELVLAPRGLWEQAVGVINPEGNPSVGEFTRRQARARSGVRDFGMVR